MSVIDFQIKLLITNSQNLKIYRTVMLFSDGFVIYGFMDTFPAYIE